MKSATAIAHPNIAFIKYWGNLDNRLRLPSNGSISMNLGGLTTRTQVAFDSDMKGDQFIINGEAPKDKSFERVQGMLNRVRMMAGIDYFAQVISENNFPVGTGIASSASAFAALSQAASCAAGLNLNERELSRLARTASGSACRSIPGGFVEWQAGEDDQSSFAFSIAPPDHWDLADCVAVVSKEHKTVGSHEGHTIAKTSPLQPARLLNVKQRLEQCRQAILERDFEALAQVAELDSNLMHAVIMTSSPSIMYWQPATLTIIHAVTVWRKSGLPCFYTIDAGPNVHVICPDSYSGEISDRIKKIPEVIDILSTRPGGPARFVN